MDGIVIIDKPKEYTSHDIVAIVKKLTGEKVGHTGTLDPNATGVLPLLLGKGTALSQYLINHDKTYIATLQLGVKTDTADHEGKVIETQDITKLKLNPKEISNTLMTMQGKQKQIPPMYSAIKVQGKKLYEYARKGESVERKSRQIEVYTTKLLAFHQKEGEIIFEISCSKGTYIRTICEELALRLGTIGFMKELRRIKVGDFKIEQALNFKEIIDNPGLIEKHVITIEKFFQEKSKIVLSVEKLELFLHGVQLTQMLPDGIYRVYHQQQFIGIGIVQNQRLKRKIIL